MHESKAQSSADEQGKSAEAALAAARSAFKEESKLELADANKALERARAEVLESECQWARQKLPFQAALKPVAAQQKGHRCRRCCLG